MLCKQLLIWVGIQIDRKEGIFICQCTESKELLEAIANYSSIMYYVFPGKPDKGKLVKDYLLRCSGSSWEISRCKRKLKITYE